MTGIAQQPDADQFELATIGPGFGESIVLHVGSGRWLVVDSCLGTNGRAAALQYLDGMGVDPSISVDLVVATHWDLDHTRGLSQVVGACSGAAFCCSSVLRHRELLAMISARTDHPETMTPRLQVLHDVFQTLGSRNVRPTFASANRTLLSTDDCEVWSLSPSDATYGDFLRSLESLSTDNPRRATKIVSNHVSVVLWIRVSEVVVLLGADLPTELWSEVVDDPVRPSDRASAFKVAHHGSIDAYNADVWDAMITARPVAVVSPFRNGRTKLPTIEGARRILQHATAAYATTRRPGDRAHSRYDLVNEVVDEQGVNIRRDGVDALDVVRLRKDIRVGGDWSIELFGNACHLRDYVKLADE